MKKLLILGASVLQVPAIRKAREMGLYTAVADYDPRAVGIPLADRYYNVSTIDEQGVWQAAADLGADGIMTLATDMPMRAAAYACGRLGLPGISYETAVRATDKGEMIRAFEAAGVAHPQYVILPDPARADPAVLERIVYPCITKPTDNSGSRGVMLVQSRDELAQALAYSSTNGRKGGVIVEEYMRGPEVSVEIVVYRGTVHVLQVTDKLTTGAPHFVEMGHSQPSRLSAPQLAAVQALAVQAVRAVGIVDGAAHVEIMVTRDGPKMVELGARLGGDCITTHLVPLSTGVDMVRAVIDIALGRVPAVEPGRRQGSAIRFFDVPCGRIRGIAGAEQARQIPGVREITFTKAAGDPVGEIGSSTDRVGFVIAQGEDAAAAVAACEQAVRTVRIDVEKPAGV
ncbi:MAG: ATP-grasp domain-containing protein [Clostridia bacterium]|nr:ATP-grasp domain-containing protein [Clostridia bacterium]